MTCWIWRIKNYRDFRSWRSKEDLLWIYFFLVFWSLDDSLLFQPFWDVWKLPCIIITVFTWFWFKSVERTHTEVFFFQISSDFHNRSIWRRQTQICACRLYEARTYSWELTYPLPFGSFESMIFLFVPCRVFQDLFIQSILQWLQSIHFLFPLNLHHRLFTCCHIPILDHQLISVLRFHGVPFPVDIWFLWLCFFPLKAIQLLLDLFSETR